MLADPHWAALFAFYKRFLLFSQQNVKLNTFSLLTFKISLVVPSVQLHSGLSKR